MIINTFDRSHWTHPQPEDDVKIIFDYHTDLL